MKGNTHSTEDIIRILRQTDGAEIANAIFREHYISEQTFYRLKRNTARWSCPMPNGRRPQNKKTPS